MKKTKKVSTMTSQTVLADVRKMLLEAPEAKRILIWTEFMRIVDMELKWRGL